MIAAPVLDIAEEPAIEIADLFCGAGGFTTGTEQTLAEMGLKANLIAVNHWPVAIETHRRNHPTVKHYVQDLTVANPAELVPGRRIDLLMASPECTYHSNARGGKPIHDQKRMDPWAVIRWLTILDVRCLLVENVPEYTKWGPLCTLARGHDGLHDANAWARSDELCDRPDPKHKGEYFEAWYHAIEALGYSIQWRTLNAADFGDATTRTRFFLQARRDDKPIVWPEPSHSRNPDTMFGGRKRWRAAREIINWSNRGPSIFERKRPLSLNTRKRTAEGLRRFSGPLAELYVALLDLEEPLTKQGENASKFDKLGVSNFVMGKQGHNPAYRGEDEPLMTVTTESAPVLVEPSAEVIGANRNNNIPRSPDSPIPAVTTAPGGGLYVVEVEAKPFTLGQQSGGSPRDVAEPVQTIATDGAIALVEPLILPYYRTGIAHPAGEPLQAVTTKDRFGLAQAIVVPYGPRADARDVDAPLHTITTKDRLAVAEAGADAFVMNNAPHTRESALVRSVDDPLYTIVTSPRLQVIEPAAFIVPQFGEREGQAPRVHDLDDPAPAVTSHGAGALVSPLLVQTDQTGSNGICVRPVDEPAPTILTNPHIGLAEPILVSIGHGDDEKTGIRARSITDPLWTATTQRYVALAEPVIEAIRSGVVDRRRLVIIDDQLCMLDIRFRMLENDELAAAMGFNTAERTYEFVGNKSEVTKQIGNAVPVRTAAALVRAVLS